MAEEIVKTIENVDKLFSEIVVNGEVHKSNRYVSPSVQSASPSSVRSTQGEDVHAVELNDVLHNFSDPDVVSDVQTLQQGLANEVSARTTTDQALDSAITQEANARSSADEVLQTNINTVSGNVSTLQGRVATIESEIPAQASSQNQLADKDFVNSSIATNTANFLGTYTSMTDIEAIQNPTNNDYVFLQTTDSAGNSVFDRYKYNADQGEWLYEYELNNSSFTAEQWATINSGLTQSSVTQEIEDAIGQYVYNSSLPTDAVLHYSFDDLPDYPDGTSDLLQTQFTSTTGWTAPSDITVSTENNSLKLVSTGSRQYVLVTNSAFSANTIKGKIVKVKVYSTDTIARCHIQEQNPSTYPEYQLTQISRSGNEYEFCGIMPSNMTYSSYLVIVFSNATSKTVYIKSIYIGDGSYTTPVIDNANGQHNGTNNGGIAVQGLSGKGVYCNKRNISIKDLNFPNNFALSLWISPENDTANLQEIIVIKQSTLYIRNGASGNNNLVLAYYQNETQVTKNIGNLLQANVWTHLVISKNGSVLKVYRNGINTHTFTVENIPFDQNDNNFNIGSTSNSRSTSYDDFQVFNRALSDTEVFALYQNKANTPKYYNLNSYRRIKSAYYKVEFENTPIQPNDYRGFAFSNFGFDSTKWRNIISAFIYNSSGGGSNGLIASVNGNSGVCLYNALSSTKNSGWIEIQLTWYDN